jgi:hypothetical protein
MRQGLAYRSPRVAYRCRKEVIYIYIYVYGFMWICMDIYIYNPVPSTCGYPPRGGVGAGETGNPSFS